MGRTVWSAYGRHAGSQLAAGIAYRVLFSLVPLLALVVSVLDLVLPREVRSDVVNWLLHGLPGTTLESAVNKSLSHPGATAPLVTLVAVVGLLWAASGMMASIRIAFRVVWEVPGPTFVRGKLRDLLLVGLAGALVLVAFGISVAAQLVAEAGKGLSDALGLKSGARDAGTIAELGAGLAVAFLALLVLYAAVPPVRVRFGRVWPSAALAAVAIELLIKGFAFYAARTSYNRIYGPLGTLFGLLLLIYLLATILLLGAELTAARSTPATQR
jgi:membrane protein